MEVQDIIALAIVAGCAVLVLRRLLRPFSRRTRAADACGGCASKCNTHAPSKGDLDPKKPHLLRGPGTRS